MTLHEQAAPNVAAGKVLLMRTLSINVSPDDLDLVEKIVTSHPLASRHAVARAALRAGLDQMARDQSYALERLLLERRSTVEAA
ncbi:MAG: hypothetical protein JNL21_38715 [Myxococcales bacterium]|nr:hypothetical protein [Myxococcales bacterium]